MLKGKTILVTGGFGRLGGRLADCLSGHGASVVITTRDKAKADAFNSSVDPSSPIRARCLPFHAENEFRQAVELLIDELPRIDGLVNNAYPEMEYKAVGAIPWDYWTTASHVSLAAAETLMSALVKQRAKTGISSIVNVSSIYGLRAPDFSIYLEDQEPSAVYYGAMKAALISLTQYLGAYWARDGVRVNAVTPGGILSGQRPAFLERYNATVPAGRMVEALEVSEAIAFLLSDAASGFTCANVVIDGGKTAT